MLELRPNCECCDKDLPPHAPDARICSFECTFCAACAEGRLGNVCPNCGGGFTPRPVRPTHKLPADPASTKRVHAKPQSPCAEASPLPRTAPPTPAPAPPPAPAPFAPYCPRPTRFLTLVETRDHALKVYGITAAPELAGHPSQPAVDAAIAISLAHLASPSPASHAGGIDIAALRTHGLGFLIVHQGRDAIFAVLESWIDENILRHALWIAPLTDPTRFEPADQSGLNVCVWELAVLAHEREAWLRHMLTPRATQNRATYLADVLILDPPPQAKTRRATGSG